MSSTLAGAQPLPSELITTTPSSERVRHSRFRRWIPLVILAAAFAHNLSYSWLKWGDIAIDCGNTLDVAKQVSEGRMLYSEVRYYYGPFDAYLNGALFRLFGVHLNVLLAAGMACTAGMCMLLYRLTRRFTGRLGATLVAASFLYLCAFGHYAPNGVFNFVLPYTYSATYGSFAATASLLFLIRHAQHWKNRDFIISVLFLAIVALGKLELLLAAGFAHALFILIAAWAGRFKVRMHLPIYALAAALVLGVYGFFYVQAGPSLLEDQLFALLGPKFRHYSRLHMGVTDWFGSLEKISLSMLLLGGLVAGCWMLSAEIKLSPTNRSRRIAFVGMAAAAPFLGYAWFSILVPFAVLPLLILGMLVWWLMGARRGRESAAVALPHLLLWSFALAILLRVFLNVSAHHYGFYLLPVPLVALAVFWLEYLPGWDKTSDRRISAYAGCGIGFFAASICFHFLLSIQVYALHTVLLDAPRGKLRLVGDAPFRLQGKYLAEATRLLATQPPETTVVVFPDGVGLTFFSGLRNPLGEQSFVYPVFEGRYDDAYLRSRLEATKPDIVVRIQLDPQEYGGLVFGVDYAVESWKWVQQHYEPFGVGRDLVLFRHKEFHPVLNLTPE